MKPWAPFLKVNDRRIGFVRPVKSVIGVKPFWRECQAENPLPAGRRKAVWQKPLSLAGLWPALLAGMQRRCAGSDPPLTEAGKGPVVPFWRYLEEKRSAPFPEGCRHSMML